MDKGLLGKIGKKGLGLGKGIPISINENNYKKILCPICRRKIPIIGKIVPDKKLGNKVKFDK